MSAYSNLMKKRYSIGLEGGDMPQSSEAPNIFGSSNPYQIGNSPLESGAIMSNENLMKEATTPDISFSKPSMAAQAPTETPSMGGKMLSAAATGAALSGAGAGAGAGAAGAGAAGAGAAGAGAAGAGAAGAGAAVPPVAAAYLALQTLQGIADAKAAQARAKYEAQVAKANSRQNAYTNLANIGKSMAV
jgi:hypothetical protein